VETEDRVLLGRRGLLLSLMVDGLDGVLLCSQGWGLFLMFSFWILRDAFVVIRDDRLLRGGVFESTLLVPGFVCFRGIVGLQGIQNCRWYLLAGELDWIEGCVSAGLTLCTPLDVIDLTAMLQSVESTLITS
jgi:hypothetical protein